MDPEFFGTASIKIITEEEEKIYFQTEKHETSLATHTPKGEISTFANLLGRPSPATPQRLQIWKLSGQLQSQIITIIAQIS